MQRESWLTDLREDLQARPGRVERSLQIVFATVVVLVAMMTLRVPNVAFALYVIFIVSNENPALSLRTGIASLVSVSVVISVALGVVVLTDNDPGARVISLAVMTFLAGMITTATTVPSLGPISGLIYGVAMGLWENHAPADRLVKSSLWLVAGFGTGIAGAVATSYLFAMRSPADRLAGQLRLRYRALAAMFAAYAADHGTEDQRRTAALTVSRIAAEGHRGMLELHRQIVDRDLPSGGLPAAVQCHIIAIAELMDSSAAFGLQAECPDLNLEARSKILAQQCADLARELSPRLDLFVEHGTSIPRTHLERVERILSSLPAITAGACRVPGVETPPSRHVPLIIPGAGSNIMNVAFALKISLCATICYIIYHAIAWPGISTSVTTVMITGLVTTGAMKQKMALRLLGATLGGLVLGIGAEVFLLPYLDSVASLMIVVGAVAFLSAWIAAGPRFNYLGIQIAFAFYLVALSGFTTPTELAPARDRFAGIVLAVVVMWFVFDQIWPVRSTTEMRRVVASVLKDAARVVALIDSRLPLDDYTRQSEVMRDRLAKGLSTVRTLNDAAKYEFGFDRRDHIQTAGQLMQMSMTAVALVWNHAAGLYELERDRASGHSAMGGFRQTLAERLSSIADAVENRHPASAEPLVAGESDSEYVRLTIARFNELQSMSAAVDS